MMMIASYYDRDALPLSYTISVELNVALFSMLNDSPFIARDYENKTGFEEDRFTKEREGEGNRR